MKRLLWVAGISLVISPPTATAAGPPDPLLRGLHNPAGVAVDAAGRIYVSTLGEIGKDGDGAVIAIDKGKAVPFARGLDDPRGVAARGGWLFVADGRRIWRIDGKGQATVFAAAAAFSPPPRSLRDLDIDEQGTLYVSDAGEGESGGTIYRVDAKGKTSLVTDAKRSPALKAPAGLAMDGFTHLLAIDSASGRLLRLRLADGSTRNWPRASATAASPGTSTAGSTAATAPVDCS